MSLLEKQQAFSILVCELLDYLSCHEYRVTLGEAYRSQETANLYEKEGKGISNSLHCSRLAIDLNLFDKDGHVLRSVNDYREAGEFWESLATPDYDTVWGGRFTRPDVDHFSIAHQGVR